MFVPSSEFVHSVKIWIVDIAEVILFLSVGIRVVVKDLLSLRDFLRAMESKPAPQLARQDKIEAKSSEELVDKSAPNE